jgi:anthranilate synthase component 2
MGDGFCNGLCSLSLPLLKIVMQHILLIDNFDSFTFNLVQLLAESGIPHILHLVKNTIRIDDLPEKTDKLLISPGPGLPHESGNLMELVGHFIEQCPVLGICLGHQAIAIHFGARLTNLPHSAHGLKSPCFSTIHPEPVFSGISMPLNCGRYHSWVVDKYTLPDQLVVTSEDESGWIMSLRHRSLPVTGLQFHPESYMTDEGRQMVTNWLRIN